MHDFHAAAAEALKYTSRAAGQQLIRSPSKGLHRAGSKGSGEGHQDRHQDHHQDYHRQGSKQLHTLTLGLDLTAKRQVGSLHGGGFHQLHLGHHSSVRGAVLHDPRKRSNLTIGRKHTIVFGGTEANDHLDLTGVTPGHHFGNQEASVEEKKPAWGRQQTKSKYFDLLEEDHLRQILGDIDSEFMFRIRKTYNAVVKLFEDADQDHDGLISYSEARAYFYKFSHGLATELDKHVPEELRTNKGTINQHRFVEIFLPIALTVPEEVLMLRIPTKAAAIEYLATRDAQQPHSARQTARTSILRGGTGGLRTGLTTSFENIQHHEEQEPLHIGKDKAAQGASGRASNGADYLRRPKPMARKSLTGLFQRSRTFGNTPTGQGLTG